MTPQENKQLAIKLGQEAGVSPALLRIGVAVLMQESQFEQMACCFNIRFRKALYNCIYDGQYHVYHKDTGRTYLVDKARKTLTYGDIVIKYWSWDRGVAMINSHYWKETDEQCFDPEYSLRLFWRNFVKHPKWWNGYSGKGYLKYL